MEKNQQALRRSGLGVCAISYDSREVLKAFADRSQITIPLLADPNSVIIRAFGILNTTVPIGQMAYGVPYPGSFLVNEQRVVVAKFFEDDYRDRYSVGTLLIRQFGSPLNTRQTTIQQDHLTIKTYASTDSTFSGSRISLIVEIQLMDMVHIYAPGVHGYLPLKWTLIPSEGFNAHPLSYPQSSTLFLPAIKEQVPVYEGTVRLIQDVSINPNSQSLLKALDSSKELMIGGSLQYQACDEKICYLPQTVPLKWVVKIQELDRQRAPEHLRRENQIQR